MLSGLIETKLLRDFNTYTTTRDDCSKAGVSSPHEGIGMRWPT
jgi:hypothetical protein